MHFGRYRTGSGKADWMLCLLAPSNRLQLAHALPNALKPYNCPNRPQVLFITCITKNQAVRSPPISFVFIAYFNFKSIGFAFYLFFFCLIFHLLFSSQMFLMFTLFLGSARLCSCYLWTRYKILLMMM